MEKMPDLGALKQKVSDLRGKVSERIDKVPFLKSWREKKAQAVAKGPDPLALSEIYKHGSTFTRFQVLSLYALIALTLVSGTIAGRHLLQHFRSSAEHEKLIRDMAQELEKTKERAIDKADVVSMGAVTTSAYVGPGKNSMATLDIWIRVQDPDAAAIANKRWPAFHDKATAVLDDLFQEKVSLLSPEGKTEARKRILAAFNTLMPEEHRVEEVYIQNLMLQ
jgi:flagellar basal body-associated protein FliL